MLAQLLTAPLMHESKLTITSNKMLARQGFRRIKETVVESVLYETILLLYDTISNPDDPKFIYRDNTSINQCSNNTVVIRNPSRISNDVLDHNLPIGRFIT